MQTIPKENSLFNAFLIVLLIVFIVSDIFVQWYYRYEGLNANTIGYFTVAQEYARGGFSNAVNGFYPPIISWLLVPFIKAGLTPLVSMRILNLITGLFVLIGINKLSYTFDISENIRNIILTISVLIILYYTTFLFPDLLIVCFLVFYLNIVFNREYSNSNRNGLLSGALGAFSYFSKNYAFPFFIVHFLLINIFHYIGSSTRIARKNVIQNAVTGMLLFFLLSGMWVFTISNKYNYFTFGTAGDYMSKLLGPQIGADYEFEDFQEDDPVYYAGLIEPPYKTALSSWDDPSYVSIKIFGDKEKLSSHPEYLLKRMVKNTRIVIQKIFVKYFSFLSIPIIIACILFCVQPLNKLIQQGEIIYPLATMFVYSAGLTPFVVNIDNLRYFWPSQILLLLMGAQVLTVLMRNAFFNNTRKGVLIVFFVLSFIVSPLENIMHKQERGEKNHALFEQLTGYNIQGNIASNDNWGYTLELAYRLNLHKSDNKIRYYGMPKKNQSDEALLLNELKAYNIDYYFLWGKDKSFYNYVDITKGKIPDLKIYKLKD